MQHQVMCWDVHNAPPEIPLPPLPYTWDDKRRCVYHDGALVNPVVCMIFRHGYVDFWEPMCEKARAGSEELNLAWAEPIFEEEEIADE